MALRLNKDFVLNCNVLIAIRNLMNDNEINYSYKMKYF